MLKNDGASGREFHSDVFSQVQWVSVVDGTRAKGMIEDRTALFLREQNVLQINADFRAFNDMIDKWCLAYQGQPGVRDTIVSAVQTWFEQALVETVIGVQN